MLMGIASHSDYIESFFFRGCEQLLIAADECLAARMTIAPYQRRGQLQRIRGAQWMSAKQPLGQRSHLFQRRNLRPAQAKSIQFLKRLLRLPRRQLLNALQASQRGITFDSGRPPCNKLWKEPARLTRSLGLRLQAT